jgi:hypothetical protein
LGDPIPVLVAVAGIALAILAPAGGAWLALRALTAGALLCYLGVIVRRLARPMRNLSPPTGPDAFVR